MKLTKLLPLVFLFIFSIGVIGCYCKTINIPDDLPNDWVSNEMQWAIDTAEPYDTIIIDISQYEIGDCTIDKPLTIMGVNPTYPKRDTPTIYITSDNVVIDGLVFRNWYYSWLSIANCDNVIVKNCILNQYPLWINNSTNIKLYNNEANSSFLKGYQYGDVILTDSINVSLENNKLTSFYIDGKKTNYYNNDIDYSNTINGNPILYLVNKTGETIKGLNYNHLGSLYLIGCKEMCIIDVNYTDGGAHILYSENIELNRNIGYVESIRSDSIKINNHNSSIDFTNSSKISVNSFMGFLQGWQSDTITIKNSVLNGSSIMNGNNVTIYNTIIDRWFRYKPVNDLTIRNCNISCTTFVDGSDLVFENNNYLPWIDVDTQGNPVAGKSILYIQGEGEKVKISNNNFLAQAPNINRDIKNAFIEQNYYSEYTGEDVLNTQLEKVSDGMGDSPMEMYDNFFDYAPFMKPITGIGPILTPIINSISIEPNEPNSNDQVRVSSNVENMDKIEFIGLNYVVDGVETDVSMSIIDNEYLGVIPAQEPGTCVEYYITIIDDDGQTIESDHQEYITIKSPTTVSNNQQEFDSEPISNGIPSYSIFSVLVALSIYVLYNKQ
ncbi:MAG: hypothetical protein NWF07_01630 [Candidatus Bathyarchaeota archaeon]|nr:hypothetical protein [Candidatus Bathyarchaeota archaeon]